MDAAAQRPGDPKHDTADLCLHKSACPSPALPCRYLVYTLTVCNNGPDAAEDVVLSDAVPKELLHVMYSLDAGQVWAPWPGTLRLGTLAACTQTTVLLGGIVPPRFCCPITNVAAVTAATPDPNLSNNTSAVVTFIRPWRDLQPGP